MYTKINALKKKHVPFKFLCVFFFLDFHVSLISFLTNIVEFIRKKERKKKKYKEIGNLNQFFFF